MLDSPASTPRGRAEHGGARVVAGALLPADAGIHVYEATDADVPFLLPRGPRLGWVVGGLTALLTTIGYIVTRATPIPTDEADYGNWLEPLGVCSLVIQGIIVVMAAVALSGPAPVRPGHLAQEARSMTPGLRPDDPGSGPPDEPPTSP
ncbi:hypothetical protein ACFYY3_15190 [Streptomyces sp. NPDC001812]|uniref:hypothetical protein n=1 Tax=unclassified Streptomyces TaxID=2593676 RepID=UPI003693D3EF